ncbi:MAG: hypothetical protein K2J51_05865 [Alistipes sp.]|nr:hypothetical protein [Alistipes sp.]
MKSNSCKVFLYIIGLLVAPVTGAAQNDFAGGYVRPLSDVAADVEQRFDVRISFRNIAPDTVGLSYADFRIRPYSVERTLTNICAPLDLKWSRRPNGSFRIEPYEYHRRTVEEGREMLAWPSSQYGSREEWERRREVLIGDVRRMMNPEPWFPMAEAPNVVRGRELRKEGYTVRNFALETLPGLYVCGSVYAPARGGSHPLVVVPSGHWPGGRLREEHQLLMASLARMGAVAVDMDIFGWGDSELQVGADAHRAGYSMRIQALWSKAVTDWVLRDRRDIDLSRIGVTGGSGGATHALLLALLDERVSAAAPMVHLVSHFDGGCPCESGIAVSLAGRGSCMPELLATLAPRPVLVVSDGGDWTASWPELEYPFVRRIWEFYDAADRVRNVHLPDERHDVGPSKRRAVYEFFAEVFGLDPSRADERRVEVLPEPELRMFADGVLPDGAVASREELEKMIMK